MDEHRLMVQKPHAEVAKFGLTKSWTNPFNPSIHQPRVNLDGILPSSGVETSSQEKPKLPEKIPNDAIWPIASEQDVDELPRGALAFLESWDDDLALDLVVAGAGITLLTRADHEQLGDHEDFDPEGFGVLDGDTLELPGGVVYVRDGEEWALQSSPASSNDSA